MKGSVAIEEYFGLYEKYRAEFGDRSVVLYQKGVFYEIYGVDNDKEKIGDVATLAKVSGLYLTKADNNLDYNNRGNPQLIGFPIDKLDHYVELFLHHGYTLVVVNQQPDSDAKGRKVRDVFRVFSPATYLNYSSGETHTLVSVFVSTDSELTPSKTHIGLALIDINTGRSVVYHFYDTDGSRWGHLQDIVETNRPSELVLAVIGAPVSAIALKITSASPSTVIHHAPAKLVPFDEANELFAKWYSPTGKIAPVEALGIERYPEVTSAFYNLLKFIAAHDSTKLTRLPQPTVSDRTSNLIVSAKTLQQLDVDSTDRSELTVFKHIDFTRTAMGKRMLKNELYRPLSKRKALKTRYSKTEAMTRVDEAVDVTLKTIIDIDRLHRRMSMGIVTPPQIGNLITSYTFVSQLFDLVSAVGYPVPGEVVEHLAEFRRVLAETIDSSKTNYPVQFLARGVSKTVDELVHKCSKRVKYLSAVISALGSSTAIKINGSQIKYWDPEEFYPTYEITTTRTGKNAIEKDIQNRAIPTDPITYTQTSSVVHVSIASFEDKLREYKVYRKQLEDAVKTIYSQLIQDWTVRFGALQSQLVDLVAEIDFHRALAIASVKYGWVRPKVKKAGYGFLRATGLRHPLVEVLNEDTPFVANDVHLGGDVDDEPPMGVLLYGANSAGKTTILKSLGIAVLLAQIGCYVPATKFVYSPFTKIISKMTGEDNLRRGYSTHIVELMAMKEMVERADRRTLVLADELASGTETTSAVAELAATVELLATAQVPFVFVTHYHELKRLGLFESVPRVLVQHIEILIKHGVVTYNRVLKSGTGSDRYGLKIAKSIGMNDKFMELAKKYEAEVLEEKKRRSRYHSKMQILECSTCRSTRHVETHHIRLQCEADDNGMIDGKFHKNVRYNLVALCRNCHEATHRGEITIHGYIETSEGVVLSYDRR